MLGPVLGARTAEMDEDPEIPALQGLKSLAGTSDPRNYNVWLADNRKSGGNTGWVSKASERTEGKAAQRALIKQGSETEGRQEKARWDLGNTKFELFMRQ